MKPQGSRIWTLILAILFLGAGSANLWSQCSGGTNIGSITPTIPWQTWQCIKGGQYLEFTATANSFYTFTFCIGGGAATWDTQLTILDNSGNFAGGYADDECLLGSYLPYWQAPATGTYRILVNTYPCITGPDCGILAYKCENVFPVSPGNIAANAFPINSLPFSGGGLSTCTFGNNYNSTMACGSTYMNGEDFIFSYNGTIGECLNIFLTETFTYTGVFLFDGDPANPATNCVAFNEASAGRPFITNAILPTTRTYYIVVSTSTPPNCTPFDIEVTNCPAIPGQGNTCGTAIPIASLPYSQKGYTTCGFGNDYDNSDACNSDYMSSEDMVFRYNSPGNECIQVQLSNTQLYTGFHVLDGCPDAPGTNCIAARGEVGGNPILRRIELTAPGDYYIVVSSTSTTPCTQFDLEVSPCTPLCNRNANASDTCSLPTAVSLAQGDTVCGFTNLDHTVDAGGNLSGLFCGSLENNSWFTFIADSVEMSFGIDVGNCISGFGMQAEVFSTSNCNSFVSVSTCWNPMAETNGFLRATGLTVGNPYYIMLDGYAGDDCEYLIYRVQGPLPVEFGPLVAMAEDEVVTLNWETYAEVNSTGFVIERGQQDDEGEIGHIRWEDVGAVQSQGDHDDTRLYSYQDEVQFNGEPYFYRIRQVDNDGKFSFSETVSVKIAGPDDSELLDVYPNPAQDQVNIRYFSKFDGQVELHLYNLTGQEVFVGSREAEKDGVYVETLDLNGVESGLYIYTIRIGSRTFNGKLDVIR